ncbi:hypothetical protein LINGRAHAP2_LOCUS17880, partial [Linum grandiflorum]
FSSVRLFFSFCLLLPLLTILTFVLPRSISFHFISSTFQFYHSLSILLLPPKPNFSKFAVSYSSLKEGVAGFVCSEAPPPTTPRSLPSLLASGLLRPATSKLDLMSSAR